MASLFQTLIFFFFVWPIYFGFNQSEQFILFVFHYSLISLIHHQQYCITPSQMLKFSFHIRSWVKKGNSQHLKETHNFGRGKTIGNVGKRVSRVSSLIFYPVFSLIWRDAFLWAQMENISGLTIFFPMCFQLNQIRIDDFFSSIFFLIFSILPISTNPNIHKMEERKLVMGVFGWERRMG